ncbi:rhomboid domain-containing protein 2-like [Synchiropus splendidus]|uniref:rhomboid domain-containing protein 2-like n=1 Tax=Synchiropus splendidus TaxID=270530 RepID=UPI00237E87A6|nr:rhomboid domain-containing protein 2-like [Synchiropus splendidus]
MAPRDYIQTVSQIFRGMTPSVPTGISTVSVLSVTVFAIQASLALTPGTFSVGSDALRSGHLHRLILFPLYHRSSTQLLLSITTFVFLSRTLENGLGTVRFLFLFVVLSTCTGLLYSVLDLLLDKGDPHHTEGLVPAALACVALSTMHSNMSKGFLCGVSFSTMALPWVFVMATSVLIPHAVLPCNITAALVGGIHGKGWFSYLDLTEARAGVLEKMMPFRLLRKITLVTFVPASTEERRKTLLPQVNPTPGSYPVQAYAPLSSINSAGAKDMTYEGWVTSPPTPAASCSEQAPAIAAPSV